MNTYNLNIDGISLAVVRGALIDRMNRFRRAQRELAAAKRSN